MITKTKRITYIILTALIVIVLIVGGVMKIIGAEPEMVIQFLTKAGFGDYIIFLGLTEIIIAGLIIYPITNKIGFLLATGYFGGALCLELAGKQFPASVVFLVLLWTGMFLKHSEMFIAPAKNTEI